MHLETNNHTLNIYGNIKTVNDFINIRDSINGITDINIIDSISITSRVIFLVKDENIRLRVNHKLTDLLKDLNIPYQLLIAKSI